MLRRPDTFSSLRRLVILGENAILIQPADHARLRGPAPIGPCRRLRRCCHLHGTMPDRRGPWAVVARGCRARADVLAPHDQLEWLREHAPVFWHEWGGRPGRMIGRLEAHIRQICHTLIDDVLRHGTTADEVSRLRSDFINGIKHLPVRF